MIRDRKDDIPRFKDVSDADWNDYKWQLRNRLTTTEDFESVLNLTDAQRKDLDACMGKFRVTVTPYYASLMDSNDPPTRYVCRACRRRPSSSSTPRTSRTLSPRTSTRHAAHHAPLPRPRAFVVTEMCSMYCRHCTRRRLVGGSEDIVAKSPRSTNAITYIERSPEVPATSLDQRRRPLGAQRRAAPETHHRPGARHRPRGRSSVSASRMPVVCPQRITPELVAMLAKYHPLYLNTHFNHPQEFTPESKLACEPPGRRRHTTWATRRCSCAASTTTRA